MKKINLLFCLFILFNAFTSCSKEDTGNENSSVFNIKIDPTIVYQNITGFGGANKMWGSETLSTADALQSFGEGDNQLGLSIFRVRLSSNKAEWPLIVSSVKEANKYGVKVLACPWSPPAALKSNNSNVGGYLLPANYEAFKNYINEFIAYMATNGAKIDVISIQNEPDWKATYESCDYTAADFINFLKAPGTIVGAKVAAPESLNFNQTLTNAILNDATASQKIDIVAGHTYGGGTAKFPLAEQKGKEIWMTEYLLNLNTGNAGAAAWSTYSETAKWNETITMLTGIHNGMSSNWNAYIWWYIKRYYSFIGDGEQGTVNGEILKRGVAYSHYSKFVRPGFVRIGSDLQDSSNLKATFYKKGSQIVVVIINSVPYNIRNIRLNSGLTPTSATSYSTNVNVSMEKKELKITDGAVALDVLPYGVTTVLINN